MQPPPSNGNPFDTVPADATNREAWGCVIAWEAYRGFASIVLDQAISEMYLLQGVPM